MSFSELEDVVGGTGGSRKSLPQKEGYAVYQIRKGDTLIKIAKHYGTSAARLKEINPTITDMRGITAGFYIYVPQ